MKRLISSICSACIHENYCKQDEEKLKARLGKKIVVPSGCPLLSKPKKKIWSVS